MHTRLLACLAILTGSVSAQDDRPNVLFVAIDDLNDWIEPLGGHPQAKTPNLNRLAAALALLAVPALAVSTPLMAETTVESETESAAGDEATLAPVTVTASGLAETTEGSGSYAAGASGR